MCVYVQYLCLNHTGDMIVYVPIQMKENVHPKKRMNLKVHRVQYRLRCYDGCLKVKVCTLTALIYVFILLLSGKGSNTQAGYRPNLNAESKYCNV